MPLMPLFTLTLRYAISLIVIVGLAITSPIAASPWPDWLRNRELSLSEAPDGLGQLATSIVMENLPKTYEDNKRWGRQKEVYRGIKLRREGWKLETKRRRKRVNHGSWERYELKQIDPQKNVSVRFSQVETNEDGSVSFHLKFVSRVNAYARFSEWNRGVRLLSISLDADADVILDLDCTLDVDFVATRFPPDVILKPKVDDASLNVRRFRVNRVSHFDGPVARELGDSLKKMVVKKVNEKRPKLVAKINRQIAKNEDKLRLSLSDAMRDRWHRFLQKDDTNEINGGNNEEADLPVRPPNNSSNVASPNSESERSR